MTSELNAAVGAVTRDSSRHVGAPESDGRIWINPTLVNDGNGSTRAHVSSALDAYEDYLVADLGAEYEVSAFTIYATNTWDTIGLPQWGESASGPWHDITTTPSGIRTVAPYGETLAFAPIVARYWSIRSAAGSHSSTYFNTWGIWGDPISEDLVCAFTATPVSGASPLTVEFTDESTGDPDAWLWQFGDGTSSSEQDPLHEYTEPGDYDVTLSVSKGEGGGGGEGDPGELGALTFELVTAPDTLNPLMEPTYISVGDPGFGYSSDFMSSLDQVDVSGTDVTITAERMTTPSGKPYASGCMWPNAGAGFSQLYGTWVIRCKYPPGKGLWPAFWLIEPGSPFSPPEVDIFEASPGDPGAFGGLNKFSVANHWGGTPHSYNYDAGVDLTDDFHTWKLVWVEDALLYYFDGDLIHAITDDVPQVPLCPVVNLALGITAAFQVDGTTPDPAVMEIEYLRVYAPAA